MKRLFSIIMGITMLMCLLTGCGNKEEPKNDTEQTESKVEEVYEPTQYSVGTVSDGIYKNESLRLKYTPVDNMIALDSDDPVLKEMKEAMQTMLSKLNAQEAKLEFVVQEKEDSRIEDGSQVMVVSYKLDMSDEEFIKKMAENSAIKTKICNIEFYKQSIGDQSSDVWFRKKIGNNLVMIQVEAESEEQVNKILSGFSKL